MYNALTGMGGSGQVSGTVAANSNVATHACTAGAALFLVGAFYKYLGPRVSLLIGGWTYALYAGSLLNYNRTANGSFVIAAGALLGIGAAFFWVAQGTIMVTYTKDSTRGRAIGLFWVIFNLGGAIGSLASFGLNYHSKSGTVTDSTYIAYTVIMLVGWALSILVCSTESLSRNYDGGRIAEEAKTLTLAHLQASVVQTLKIVLDWKIMCLYPMFFNANVFYSYQQNNVNGTTFNLRTRSLNSALYWIAQMVGGLLMGFILDLKFLNRQSRAKIGWAILFITGMAIWGGGYKFQIWEDWRLEHGHKQDIDYKAHSVFLGPMFLYFFYGVYDAFWQSYCYWIIGAQSHSPVVNAVIVGAYSAFKPAGGSMAWKVNAVGVSAMKQFAMNWGMTIGSLLVAIPSVLALHKATFTSEVVADTEEKSDETSKV
ncbi:putative unc93-like protein [Phaeoacremonium minimum UCRPA7]|uniref:Putative unc93-like protein n=1 Tax=Phaeoacremonium minimum (strain UCR-PA7) TaxID=1286976 RepID=R8BPD2_PHAM7|nr:putative unc93-like protein [Phaeoacremonium minimum UCRPA7]EOO01196.1 putative unc93-like protein [Phaeoacremonium minimum UCRPA7]